MALLSVRRRGRAKWIAVGLIVLIEIGAVYFLILPSLASRSLKYTFPPLTTSSTTTTTKSTTTSKTTTKTTSTTTQPAPSLDIKSAVIINDTLVMDVKNKGTVPTKTLTLSDLCTPGFTNCYSYTKMGGKDPTRIFVLPTGGEFMENVTGVCVAPVPNCSRYYPVAGFTYYIVVEFTAPSGMSTYVAVIANGNNTYPANSAVEGVVYSFVVYSKNLTGSLMAYIATNSSENKASFTGNLFMQNGKKGFTFTLLTNETGCGGKYSADCSSGNVTMSMNFTEVNSGIATYYYPPPYLLVIRDLTLRTPTYFAMWVAYKQEK